MTETIQCPGFHAAGVAAGIKKDHQLDLGMIHIPRSASVAAVFTRNRVQAAPVVLSKSRLAKGQAKAVIVNSGNANCCTGSSGMSDAEAMAAAAGAALDIAASDVWVASTGVIGVPLPLEKIRQAVPEAVGRLRADGFGDFARAIMTTDRQPKLVRAVGEIDGQPFTLLAAAKGAGMIRPDMATMLCFICTDVQIPSDRLQNALAQSVDGSFNRISIDGDTSTNDMVLAMASGSSGARVETAGQAAVFQRALDSLCVDVARRLVQDGEGVTKMVTIRVRGATSDAAALQVAGTVAHSPLVKTAFFGEDANWGRIIAAAGRAGVPFDPDLVDLYFDDVRMVHRGQGCGAEAEDSATEVLRKPEFEVIVDLNGGQGRASMLTCDFSVEYVRINADYRS